MMRQMGTLCALILSIITSGYQMEWDPIKGPAPPPVHLRNHNSALAEATFVTAPSQPVLLQAPW